MELIITPNLTYLLASRPNPSIFVGTKGLEPSCDLLPFLHFIRVRGYVPIKIFCVPVVGLEPTYRKGQYELFVDAGRFYRPLPLHWQFRFSRLSRTVLAVESLVPVRDFNQPPVWNILRYLPFPDLELPGFFQTRYQ